MVQEMSMKFPKSVGFLMIAALVMCLSGSGNRLVMQAESRPPKVTRVEVAKNEAPRALVEQMVRDDEQAKECLASEHNGNPELLGGNLKVRRVNLNRDAKPEYIVNLADACGGGQNSPIFVYQRTLRGYSLLLKDSGTDLSVRRTVTNGYRDLVVVAHGSAIDHEITFYKFREGKYRQSKQFNERSR